MINRILTLVLVILALIAGTCYSQAIHPVEARYGMVVSTNDIATSVGLEILKKGGNAIDAAVATAFALAVTYPSCGNLGGDGFLLYYKSDGTCTALDFRIKAPKSSSKFMYIDESTGKYKDSGIEGLEILDSALSIGVPGTVAGLDLAHKKYGKLSWRELLEPAINLAENGFPVGRALSKEMKENIKYILNYESSKKYFLKEDGSVYQSGEIWKQPDLAKTLRTIQEKGKEGFYKGKIAERIATEIQKHGGIITVEDLAEYEAVELAPMKGSYRGYDIYAMPLPSSGGITQLEILNLLEGYDLKACGHNSAQYIHYLIEAMKCGYKDRALHLGDPKFNPEIPVDRLISKGYASELRASITPDSASKSDVAGLRIANEAMETTHFSVVDAEGNAVSLTTSQNGDFGSFIVPEGTGVLLNNTMGDFNFAPHFKLGTANLGAKPNWIQPGKKPLSSMTPTIVAKDGKLAFVIGSPGGTTIIATNIQIFLNLVEFEMSIAEAVAAPRFYHGWLPDFALFQRDTASKDTQELLEKMGHTLKVYNDLYFGPAMCIVIDPKTGTRFSASDPRSLDGLAAGY